MRTSENVERSPSYERLRRLSDFPALDSYGIHEQAKQSFCQSMGRYILDDAYGLWLPPDSGDGHCDPENLVVDIGTRIGAFSGAYAADLIKSPIEGMLLGALVWMSLDWAGLPSVEDFDIQEVFWGTLDPKPMQYTIFPQASVGNYKVDFLLWISFGKHRGGLAIECDGHAFHEKTKEQAARDKRRDREILSAGYPMMRFTGSEIFKDAVGCVEQIKEPARAVLHQVSKAGGLY